MPPNSTQNLNAKLSPSTDEAHHTKPARSFSVPPIQAPAPPVRILGGPRYRGGYHLNV